MKAREMKITLHLRVVTLVTLCICLLGCVGERQNEVSLAATPAQSTPQRQEGSVTATAQPTSQSQGGISLEEAQRQKASQPSKVTLEQNGGTTLITWPGIGIQVSHYQIYRRAQGEQQWTPLAQVQSTRRNREVYEFRDESGTQDQNVYGVTTVNLLGSESDMVTTDGQTIRTPLP